MVEFLARGGLVIYPLLICSVLGLGIVIEKTVGLRHRRVIDPEFVDLLQKIRGPEDIGLALSLCEHRDGSFASIIRVGLESRDLPKEEIREALNDQGRQEVHRLERGLIILETIAGIAPLLGLLGTVIGILKVFDVITVMGVGQAAALSGGISEALITTIVGLSIGIPALVLHNYFTHKVEGLVLEIEKHSSMLLRKVAAFQAGGKG